MPQATGQANTQVLSYLGTYGSLQARCGYALMWQVLWVPVSRSDCQGLWRPCAA